MKKATLATVLSFVISSPVLFAQENPSPPIIPSTSGAATEGPSTTAALPASVPTVHHDAPADATPSWSEAALRGWVDADYLLWWMRSRYVPALVTASPAGTSPDVAGLLGKSTTAVVIGDQNIGGGEVFNGGRVSAGLWLSEVIAVEARGFLLERKTEILSASSDADGNPILARPRFNALLNSPGVQFVSFPGAFAGRVDVSSPTRLWGAETNVVVGETQIARLHYLVGFRYLNLQESLTVTQFTALLDNGVAGFNGTPVLSPNALSLTDNFDVRNEFFGGQVGLRGEFELGPMLLGLSTRVALGSTNQIVDIRGNTNLLSPGGVVGTAPGALLALPSNTGRTNHGEFTVVPELELKIGYQFTRQLAGFVGYNFLYWSSVVRPGDQVDPTVNPAQQPSSLLFGQAGGTARPATRFDQTDFWAQGVNFTLLFRY
jgi:hypothetical protein